MSNLSIFNEVLNLFREKYSYFITRDDAENTIMKDVDLYKYNKKLIDKFIEFYNSLEKNKLNNNFLSNDNKLCHFFIDENNSIGKSYIDIYNDFILLQNKLLEPLLDIKIENGIFDLNCKNEVSIQNVKEDQIFSFDLPNKSFLDIIFENSYRKYALNREKTSINEYEIDLEEIENDMTEILLKNKKLYNKNISKFIYESGDINFENINIIYKFNKNYYHEELLLEDKFIIYNYYEENQNDINVLKNNIKDFKALIIFLNNSKFYQDKFEMRENNKIYDGFKIIENILYDKNIINIFKDKDIKISKLSNIFQFFLILIYPKIKNDLSEYEVDIPEDKIEQINNYFKENHIITRENLSYALRIFSSSFLTDIKDKEKKIKNNLNNFVDYLDIPDIWEKNIYTKNEFRQELNKLKSLKIQFNQILKLYDIIGNEFNEIYFSDINKEKERIKEEKEKKEKEKEKKEDEIRIDNEEEDDEDDLYDRMDDYDDDYERY